MMVKLNHTHQGLKRKRDQNQKTAERHARYPASFYLSALTYKQALQSLSISPQGVLLSIPTPPNKTQFNTIAGDLFSLNAPIRKSNIKLMESYHKHRTITHLEWEQKGNTVASVDEAGNLALWHIENSVHEWKLLYSIELKQPLAAFLWLDSDRVYEIQPDSSLKREPFKGPRNPYGQLSFVTVTVHGEIDVHYQRNGSIFSRFSTSIPNIGRREISGADAGCYGMSLAGLDDWERLSHAAITMNNGQIYLASHQASNQHKSIFVHSIRIKFPQKTNDKGAIECKPITTLKLQKQKSLQQVTHLAFKKTMPIELVIGTGREDASTVSIWQLKMMQAIVSSDFGSINVDRPNLVLQSSINIVGRFISSLKTTKRGSLVVGLSDSSIHIEQHSEDSLSNSNSEQNESIGPNFYEVTKPYTASDGCIDPVADIITSPNETHIVYCYSTGRIGISRITTDVFSDAYVRALGQMLQLALLNNTDYLDLVSELIRMSKLEEHKDTAHTLINQVLNVYEMHYSNSDTLVNQPLDQWSLAHLERAYGLAMAVYSRLPKHKIQHINLSRAIQLPVILECFIGSCTTNYSEVIALLNKPNIDTNSKLDFDPDSLWSLVSLSTWIFDYVRWILAEWFMSINCKRPNNTQYMDTSDKKVHGILLMHQDSRITLCKVLKLVHYFIQYTTTTSYQLSHLPESQLLLQRYISTLKNDKVIALDDTIDFLNALDELRPKTTVQGNRWSLLLSSSLENYDIASLQAISNKYQEKCAKPCIYIEKKALDDYDVVRKRHLPSNAKTQQCIRCQEFTLYTDTTKSTHDPYYSAQWYQSIGKHCVCGGVFY